MNATPIEVFFQCFQGFEGEESMEMKSDSSRTGTAIALAFSNFEPASEPATR
jgi:hypothetical protein